MVSFFGPFGEDKDDADVTYTNGDGQTFYGYNDEESNTTIWYGEDGIVDCITETPTDED